LGSGPRYLICTPTGAPAIWMKAVVSVADPENAPAMSSVNSISFYSKGWIKGV
jgi:hypothetical protein